MTENRFPKLSELSLTIKRGAEKSVPDRCYFTPPFKITSPFYTEDGLLSIMVLSVSAGLMAGDRQKIAIRLEKGASARIGSQSFEKIHKMGGNQSAFRETTLSLESGSFLMYSPLPVIPFARSAFESRCSIYLRDSGSRLIYSEILSCGRAARGERFAWRFYKNRVRILQEGRLIYFDNTDFRPAETDMENFTMFEGYSHFSNLVLVNIPLSPEQREEIGRDIRRFPGGAAGMSLTGSGALCVRSLGNSAEAAMEQHRRILALIPSPAGSAGPALPGSSSISSPL
ncbi:MAG: urease accessory protein UreD [Spirochaetaceae bacterium]|jgi:urease accessory protein|nr:urease accessory protein UreD [Spirochaetaceae bacterium]